MDITFKKHRKLKPCLVLKKWSLSFHHPSLNTQTLFFHPLKIKHVWIHFLFYVTQNFAIMVGPIYYIGSDGYTCLPA